VAHGGLIPDIPQEICGKAGCIGLKLDSLDQRIKEAQQGLFMFNFSLNSF
jgi:hypothetical protein